MARLHKRGHRIIKITIKRSLKNCVKNVKEENIVKTAEWGANEYLKKYCDNPILKETVKLIEDLGGFSGLYIILRTRVNEIKVNEDKSRYIVCVYDFYEGEMRGKKGYTYRSIECCLSEEFCRSRNVTNTSKSRYREYITIGRNNWICWLYSSSKPLLHYVKYYIILPLRRNKPKDVALRKFYLRTGLLKNIPQTSSIGPHTKLCSEKSR